MVFLFYRFDYSPEFLAWALKPPGYLKEWHCGVRVTKSNKLVGFISAVPAHMRYIFFYFFNGFVIRGTNVNLQWVP